MNLTQQIQARAKAFPQLTGRRLYVAGKDRLGYVNPGAGLIQDSVSESECSARFVISTQVQDRDGDVVVSRGCQLEHYSANPIGFFGHQSLPLPILTSQNPAGYSRSKPVEIDIEPARVIAKGWFDQGSADAMEIFRLVCKGLLRMTSIGFQPLVSEKLDSPGRNGSIIGWLIKVWDLLEWSIVGIGANPEALAIEINKSCCPATVRKAMEPWADKGKVWANGVILKGSNPTQALQEAGKWLAQNGLMPGYGQIFIRENGSGEAWYVGGDGDEDGFAKLVNDKLTAIEGIDEVTYEAEGFPPKDQGWIQVYPKERDWKVIKPTKKGKLSTTRPAHAPTAKGELSMSKKWNKGQNPRVKPRLKPRPGYGSIPLTDELLVDAGLNPAEYEPHPMLGKEKAAKAPQGMNEQTGSEGGDVIDPKKKGAGTDVQALSLPKAKFPDQQQAAQWVEQQGYDSSQMTDAGDSWVFEQFPLEQLGGSETTQTIADGVSAVVGQQQTSAVYTEEDQPADGEAPPVDGEAPPEGPIEKDPAAEGDPNVDPNAEAGDMAGPSGDAALLQEVLAHTAAHLPSMGQSNPVREFYTRFATDAYELATAEFPDMDWGEPPAAAGEAPADEEADGEGAPNSGDQYDGEDGEDDSLENTDEPEAGDEATAEDAGDDEEFPPKKPKKTAKQLAALTPVELRKQLASALNVIDRMQERFEKLLEPETTGDNGDAIKAVAYEQLAAALTEEQAEREREEERRNAIDYAAVAPAFAELRETLYGLTGR